MSPYYPPQTGGGGGGGGGAVESVNGKTGEVNLVAKDIEGVIVNDSVTPSETAIFQSDSSGNSTGFLMDPIQVAIAHNSPEGVESSVAVMEGASSLSVVDTSEDFDRVSIMVNSPSSGQSPNIVSTNPSIPSGEIITSGHWVTLPGYSSEGNQYLKHEEGVVSWDNAPADVDLSEYIKGEDFDSADTRIVRSFHDSEFYASTALEFNAYEGTRLSYSADLTTDGAPVSQEVSLNAGPDYFSLLNTFLDPSGLYGGSSHEYLTGGLGRIELRSDKTYDNINWVSAHLQIGHTGDDANSLKADASLYLEGPIDVHTNSLLTPYMLSLYPGFESGVEQNLSYDHAEGLVKWVTPEPFVGDKYLEKVSSASISSETPVSDGLYSEKVRETVATSSLPGESDFTNSYVESIDFYDANENWYKSQYGNSGTLLGSSHATLLHGSVEEGEGAFQATKSFTSMSSATYAWSEVYQEWSQDSVTMLSISGANSDARAELEFNGDFQYNENSILTEKVSRNLPNFSYEDTQILSHSQGLLSWVDLPEEVNLTYSVENLEDPKANLQINRVYSTTEGVVKGSEINMAPNFFEFKNYNEDIDGHETTSLEIDPQSRQGLLLLNEYSTSNTRQYGQLHVRPNFISIVSGREDSDGDFGASLVVSNGVEDSGYSRASLFFQPPPVYDENSILTAEVLKQVPGYVEGSNQKLVHDTDGDLSWVTEEGGTALPSLIVVEHGENAGTPRPVGAIAVYWIGSVEPSNATDNDLWIGGA